MAGISYRALDHTERGSGCPFSERRAALDLMLGLRVKKVHGFVPPQGTCESTIRYRPLDEERLPIADGGDIRRRQPTDDTRELS